MNIKQTESMIRELNSKKSVSPLIATVLLIAFAVALGSVVMNWGLNLNLGKPTDSCRGVEIKLRAIDSSEACYGGFGPSSYINFIADNTGTTDIQGLAVWIVGDKGTSFVDLGNILIKKGDIYDKKDKEFNYDPNIVGNIRQIQFIPKIRVDQSTEICPKNAVKADKIAACTGQSN